MSFSFRCEFWILTVANAHLHRYLLPLCDARGRLRAHCRCLASGHLQQSHLIVQPYKNLFCRRLLPVVNPPPVGSEGEQLAVSPRSQQIEMAQ